MITSWLSGTDWASWDFAPMTGDASSRGYARLTSRAGATLILMDAPPDTCGSQTKFVEIAAHLRNLGLCAPDVLHWDDALGLMIIEDLGSVDFATHLRASPNAEPALYDAAVDALMLLQSAPPPDGLIRMTPRVGVDMLDIAFEWAATDHSSHLAQDIKTQLLSLLMDVDPAPSVLSLRDFHAENLIWRPDLKGVKRVGLLDFQDAFVTHAAYDLASLIHDARRDVDPALTAPLIAKMAGPNTESFTQAFHVLSLQRNLRILGIFERLAHRDGKVAYRKLSPRVWAHIQESLRTPALRDIAPLVHRAFDGKRTMR